MKIDANYIMSKNQPDAPKTWRFWRERDKESMFSGNFEVDGYVAGMHEIEIDGHETMKLNFLFCAKKPKYGFKLFETDQGGIAAQHNNSGHCRLFHILREGAISTNSELINFLIDAAENDQKVRIKGKVIHFDAIDPKNQWMFFNGFDNSNKCPVVQILSAEKTYEKPNPIWAFLKSAAP
jgi:hypothetical protein